MTTPNPNTPGADGPAVRLALVGVLLAAAALQIAMAGVHAFNQDEGLYIHAALKILDGDWLLSQTWIDKPPLLFYVQAASVWLFGGTEAAARIPGCASLLMLIWLAFRLGREVFGSGAGLLAALLLLWSPYMYFNGVTAMTDPLAAVLVAGSLLSAARHRPGLAGLLYGLSVCTRQLAAMALPVVLVVLVIESRLRAQSEGTATPWLKSFLLGLLGPAAALFVWSAFLEAEPFAWLINEFASGKPTRHLGAGTLFDRLETWLGVLGGFTPHRWLSILLAAAATLVVAVRTVPGTRRDPAEARPRAYLLILAGAALYFLLLPAAMGLPFYPRYMFPLLFPLAVLIGGAVCWRGARTPRTRMASVAVAVVLGVATLPVLSGLSADLQKPHDRDDLPEITRVIRELATGPSAVFSSDLNRQMLPYLYRFVIKRKQYHRDYARLRSQVEKYNDRRMFLILRREEFPLIEQIVGALPAGFRLEFLHRSSRGSRRLYQIVPAAQIVDESGEGFLLLERDGEQVRVELSPRSVRHALEQYARTRWRSPSEVGVEVEADRKSLIKEGVLDRLEIEARGAMLSEVPVDSIRLSYRAARLDLGRLLAAGQLTVTGAEAAGGEISVAAQGLSMYLQGKNPKLDGLYLRIAGNRIVLDGLMHISGIDLDLFAEGSLALDGEGRLAYLLDRCSVAGIGVPRFVLRKVEARINPVFDANLPGLALRCDAVETGDEGIRLRYR